jgi:integrase
MTVRKRGAHWHYDFQIEGVRYRNAIPEAKTKADATAAETKERAKVLEGRFEKRIKPPLLKEFWKEYLIWAKENKRSWRDDEKRSKVLLDKFGKLPLNGITQFAIEQFKRERLKTKTNRDNDRKPATVNRELQLLSKILTLAMERGHTSKNVCRSVKKLPENNERHRYLTTEEEAKLFEVLQDERFDRLRPVVTVALQTGMRKGELLKLEWRDIDFHLKSIRVRKENNKTGRERFVPMSETCFLILSDLSIDRKHKKVFGLLCINRAWYAALKEAGLRDFHFHDLRHTTATRLAAAGADGFVIAEILGHSNLQTTKRYAHAGDERKRTLLEKLKPTVTNLSQSA